MRLVARIQRMVVFFVNFALQLGPFRVGVEEPVWIVTVVVRMLVLFVMLVDMSPFRR